MPTLGAAKEMAGAARSLSNVRQIGIALNAYSVENDCGLPWHSSTDGSGRRWPDYLYPFMPNVDVYRSPLLTPDELDRMQKPFAHDNSKFHGGYGYNYQYLGNSRNTAPNLPFNARTDREIAAPVSTVAAGDTSGSRNGAAGALPGTGGSAVYVLDPPLGSSRTSGKGSYYAGSSGDEAGPDYLWRSFPAQRNRDKANFAFLDGHGEALTTQQVDDFDRNGTKDNGYWNGRADPNWK